MKVYLLRHGETELNKIGGYFQGQIEVPLTEVGVQQARETGEQLRKKGITFDKVYSSPLGRSLQTAECVTGKSREEFITDERLLEMGYGPFEGRRHWEMDEKMFRAFTEDAENYVPVPGGESFYALMKRASDFLEELKRTQPREHILVSEHGGTVRAMLIHLHLYDMKHFWDIPVGNCAWFELTLEGEQFKLTDYDEKPGMNTSV